MTGRGRVGDAPAGAVAPEALFGFAGLWPIVEGARGRFCRGAASSALGGFLNQNES